MKIAIEGCCHGELDAIYGSLEILMKKKNCSIDLLICCGDFQSVRNESDLECLACPPKYRQMADFYKYYTGKKVAPIPTLFIGGNHEASNHLWELYHGGWVAPNIYYLGHSGVIDFGGVRIVGLSGIYNQAHYKLGWNERPPYPGPGLRSAYHTREFEVFKLQQLTGPIDIFLSHDWPQGIAHHGNTAELFRLKPFLQREVMDGSLGSPMTVDLLSRLKPSYWFSAHLHVKFGAVVKHEDQSTTKFLALDKCLPRRKFLQVIDLPSKGPLEFSYDKQWLAIIKNTLGIMPLTRRPLQVPASRPNYTPTPEELEAVEKLVGERFRGYVVPKNFSQTVPTYDPQRKMPREEIAKYKNMMENPQTTTFCENLEITNVTLTPGDLSAHHEGGGGGGGGNFPEQEEMDPDDMDHHDHHHHDMEESSGSSSPFPRYVPPRASNPDEIKLDDSEEEEAGGGEEEEEAREKAEEVKPQPPVPVAAEELGLGESQVPRRRMGLNLPPPSNS